MSGDYRVMTDPDDHAKVCAALRVCLEALRNVPEVGQVYDQQHSDTHMKAALAAQNALDAAGED